MEYRTDVLIIGGGASGMAAAAAASEKNAKVLVLEAKRAVGGNGLFPRGIFAAGSRLQRRLLIDIDKDRMFHTCMEHSHWKIDPDIVRTLINTSGNTIDWLEKKGVEFKDVVRHIPGQNPAVFHITDTHKNVGKAVIESLESAVLSADAVILKHTQGKKLIIESHGEIAGAYAESGTGESVTVRAGKTILCTGGFAGNSELIRKFYPHFNPEAVGEGPGMRHKGDGLIMALKAGADIEGNFAMEMAAPKIKGHGPLNLLLGKPWNIWINQKGNRFADEGIVYNFSHAANAALRQPGSEMWVLFDESMKNRTLNQGRDIIELIHLPENSESELEDTIRKARKDGVLCKTDSLDEIALFIGCPAESLKKTVSAYNHGCRSNRDEQYAKKPDSLQALTDPPYYAIKAGTDMLITHGGIRVNRNFQALSPRFEPLENLYVAGVDFGGADADVYNVGMSGHGFGFAVNSGRIAGEHAASGV